MTRKKSKYRPRRVLLNPIGYVLEGMTSVKSYTDDMLALKIRNHASLAALTQGKATARDIRLLIQVCNMTEAYNRMGIGTEYAELITSGLNALRSVGQRGAATEKFILRAAEMQALNDIMELHDAQLEVSTLGEMERAIEIVNEEMRTKRATPINRKETTNG